MNYGLINDRTNCGLINYRTNCGPINYRLSAVRLTTLSAVRCLHRDVMLGVKGKTHPSDRSSLP